MRKYLFMMTVAVGLVTSVACLADQYSDCLQDNADKADKKSYCFGVIQQTANDARDKALDQANQKARTDITQQLADQLKKQQPSTQGTPATPSSSGGSSSSSSSSNAGSETATPSSDNSAPSSTGTTSGQPATSAPANTSVKPVSKDKPNGVQWY